MSDKAGVENVWAIGDGVRINPLNGKAFEENAEMLPGGVSGDYRAANMIWDGASKVISLKGAANEVLGFQLILEGPGAEDINVTACDLTGPDGARIPAANLTFFRAFYLYVEQQHHAKQAPFPLESGWYPDPLVELEAPKIGAPFTIDGSNFAPLPPDEKLPPMPNPRREPPKDIHNQTVWADLWIPKDAPAGVYSGAITVSSASGSIELTLTTEVFNFALPDENHTVLELMSYGYFPQLSQQLRDEIFNIAHQHRANITNCKPVVGYEPELTSTDGKFNWEGFDRAWGPAIDGSLYTEGPRAGVALDYFNLPFDPKVDRPDKDTMDKGLGWPIPNKKTDDGLGVDFTGEYVREFTQLLQDADRHFAQKYPDTKVMVYQDGLDEPGFHKPEAAPAFAQMRSIREYTEIFKAADLKQTIYRLDIGGGFARRAHDLDGDGLPPGTRDVVAALPDVGLWNVHGLCIDLEALAPAIANGAEVWFYNGFQPRVGPMVISGEIIGPRTWPWVAWNSDVDGMCVWHFLLGMTALPWITGGVWVTGDNPTEAETRKGSAIAGAAMLMYVGKDVGLPDRAFASVRLKAFRRGLQDYEYFHLLAQRDGDDKRAKAFSTRVVRNSLNAKLDMEDFQDDETHGVATVKFEGDQRHWSHDGDDFERIRHQIGEILSE
ncbi:MAG: DUF4091 domain-containing protein [Planctomycetes bacterium]|nr:DUF4091 domain-containing protein [Planctomycetota bacterium]